jgi:hypothetical protein
MFYNIEVFRIAEKRKTWFRKFLQNGQIAAIMSWPDKIDFVHE